MATIPQTLRLMAVTLLLASGVVRGAVPKHDLYACANLSGQSQVMGSTRVPVPSGLYASSDRQTFAHVGNSHIRVFTLTPDPVDRSTLWVALLDGVVRAKDRGRTWRTMTGWDMTEPRAIAFDPEVPDRIYAGLPDGIAVSPDRGQTWRRMNDGIRRAYTETITVDRTRSGRVLAGTEKGIYLSEDAARTWRLVQATDKTTYDLLQSPHEPAQFFAVTSVDGALRSDDGGRSWRRVDDVPREHTLHACTFDPAVAGRIALCGWGVGVRVTEDGGRTWVDRSDGLPNRNIWTLRADPDFPGRLYAAPHLSPLHVSDDFGRTWRPVAFEKAIIYDLIFVPRA
jgi:photosystem II stability/assembly factor-like uncharacterized protein